ncbi:hypothetical protein VP1G_06344 [Cytospora mali]|uniref:non-specific serine/threonine protein kinase n=1 Tax=Cytospora mali TaxID=578113 RepID=A0A194V575_CYTMA|nr:hypothetical protein VP1G_06344 [Valsa mali var. pyri (nom. inval.)]
MDAVTQETIDQRKAQESKQHDYNIIKKITDNCYIVRRKSDGTQLLAHPWDIHQTDPEFSALMERGTKMAVGNVLNHPNLINHIETQVDYAFHGTSTRIASSQNMLLWDFCDAGTLEALLQEPPVAPIKNPLSQTVRHFLPEGLCWHVVISMLKALAWLHEGYREEDYIKWSANAMPERATRSRTLDPDWMPILHRDVRPGNIFFQHPRGTETYGLCKLGNFHNCFVSGHVNNRSGGQAVSVANGDERLEVLRKTMAVENIYTVPRNKRPYTRGNDLFHLGACLYRMMCGQYVPDPEECKLCGQRHWDRNSTVPARLIGGCYPHFSVEDRGDDLAGYSSQLRETLKELLWNYRAGLNERAFTAAGLLKTVRQRYLVWKTEYPDGRLHRDIFDDEVQRYVNKEKKRAADSRQAHAQSGPGKIDISVEDSLDDGDVAQES